MQRLLPVADDLSTSAFALKAVKDPNQIAHLAVVVGLFFCPVIEALEGA